MPPWYRRDPARGVIVIRVHVQPQARRTEAAGLHGESVKIRLAAPPLDNRANEALVAYVAERFGVARRDVTLLSGEKSREKRLEVRGSSVDPEAALAPADAPWSLSRPAP